jgi:hypothetical protein
MITVVRAIVTLSMIVGSVGFVSTLSLAPSSHDKAGRGPNEMEQGVALFQPKPNSFLLRNFRIKDVSLLLQEVNALEGYSMGQVRRGPFVVTDDGLVPLPPGATRKVAELPHGMIWIGDDTTVVLIVAAQYGKVLTAQGELLRGISKNCDFVTRLAADNFTCNHGRVSQNAPFGLPALVAKLGEKGFIRFLRQESIDAVIAGPRTYDETRNILARAPVLQDCLEVAIDVESVLVLLSRPCRLTSSRVMSEDSRP